MKHEILNRYTGKVQFTAEIDCKETDSLYVKIGLAVMWGIKSGAYLRGAYLRDAYLTGAYLRGADLSGVPSIPNIHQAVYAAASKPGCFDMSDWHTCETTHCRAGWVVALAGDGGAAMEYCMGTPAAAALIYIKSDPGLEKVPDFYTNNDEALADMKRLAEMEAIRK